MAAQVMCCRDGCKAPMTHREVASEIPLCASHVGVQVRMLDNEYSVREGNMVFSRYVELLGAASDRRINSGAQEVVLAKLRSAAIDLSVWLLTKVPSPAVISIPEQNELSQEMIRAVEFATTVAVKLARDRQTALEKVSTNDYLVAMNGVWALIQKMLARISPARSRALEPARVSYTRLVVAIIKQILGKSDPYADAAQVARAAGSDLDAAFETPDQFE